MSTEKAQPTWTKLSKKLLSPDCVRAHLPVISSLQETRSWDVENLRLPDFVFLEVIFGSSHSSSQVAYVKYGNHGDMRRDVQQCSLDRCSSWQFTRQTQAKTSEEHDKFLEEMTKNLHEGRWAGGQTLPYRK